MLSIWPIISYVYAEDCVCPDSDPGCKLCNYPSADNWWWIGTKTEKTCPGIKLNTNFPFIWNCIWDDPDENETKAFPTMVWAITKIVMSLILVVCFILIIYAGILWASNKPTDAKKWLTRVAVTILLLWFSWAILRLINPNFFS